MKRHNLLSTSIKCALITAAATASNSVLAQDEQATKIERVEVTGSRILREGAIAPAPVTVISGEQLINTGAVNIGEALNNLPALGNTYSMANSGRFIGTAGLNILDLRNMGTDRTLVLVNGKRHVSSSAGSQAVDTNTIPSVWVERVEIITGGASAVYGADAVTGVVNFILKDNIEGMDFSVTRGFADLNSYNNEKATFSYGSNFDNDRGNAAFAIEYSGQDSLNALDHPWTSTSFSSLPNQAQTDENKNSADFPDKILTPNAGYFAINDAGVYALEDPSKFINSFNPDSSARDLYIGNNADPYSCAECDFFNLGQFEEIQPEFERYNVNFKVNYDVTDDLNVYFDAKYVNSQGESIGQPAFFFFDSDNSIKIDNPYLDPDIKARMQEEGVDSIMVNRMMSDLGRRVENNTRETTRFVTGLKGTVFEDWELDTSVVYGQTDLERENGANMILANYFNALDAVEDADGNIVCRSAAAQADGCVPVNIMGFGAPSQQAIDYINTVSVGTSTIKQTVVSGSLANGAIFELPAGYVGVAFGAEYRKEESETKEPDNAEGTFFNALGEDKGSFNVREVFFEATMPILTDLPLIQDLVFDTAVRHADYSTIGEATSWKLGLDWTVNDELRVRVTQSAALRAPNISEVFGAASQTFYNVEDPCRAENIANLSNAATRTANCAALGVASDFNSGYDSASLDGLTSGNRDVKGEESTSTTVGIVYQPEFLENAVLTIDYWEIDLENAIDTIDAQEILDRCVDSTTGIDNQYCNLITRNASGEISLIQNSVLNVAGQKASGVDFELGYDFDALEGSFKTRLIGTYLIERKDYPFQDDPSSYIEYAGTTGEAKWQTNLSVSYVMDNFYSTVETRFISEVDLYTNVELASNSNPSNQMSYGKYFITDMTVGYNFDSGLGVKVGVDNLFNRKLPYGTRGTGENSASYDNIGRFGYINLSYSL
ncbi:TonB-dependent receptor [Pseudoalteromonas sp. S327]|uniref:TonB-dependent receptor domain-containing protein n=1 Tax=Pseudoalteromonas TaxID=53246 RepID=UPI00110B8A46|nr:MULTISPECIES: TonB-dependent receptor [unclassified Pseudoalteromonas]TMO08005.1 TonB-dependent receptor [Pseudoalteromonas sp. S327]TMO19705.1 TonB-dependent receptor [Pseudoalteromonas sp. S326]